MKPGNNRHPSPTSPAIQKDCPPGYVFGMQIEEPLTENEARQMAARIIQPSQQPTDLLLIAGHYKQREKNKCFCGFCILPVPTGWMVFRPLR